MLLQAEGINMRWVSTINDDNFSVEVIDEVRMSGVRNSKVRRPRDDEDRRDGYPYRGILSVPRD